MFGTQNQKRFLGLDPTAQLFRNTWKQLWDFCNAGQPRKTCDIIILMGSRMVDITPTYSVQGGPALTAISLRFSEAKSLSDIKFICQIFFRAKCFSKLNFSQVLTKASPMDYSQYIWRTTGPGKMASISAFDQSLRFDDITVLSTSRKTPAGYNRISLENPISGFYTSVEIEVRDKGV